MPGIEGRGARFGRGAIPRCRAGAAGRVDRPAEAIRVVDELPEAIAVGILERLIRKIEVTALDRGSPGTAADTHDALAVGSQDRRPVRVAGHRIRIKTPQVMLGDGEAVILQQLIESARES